MRNTDARLHYTGAWLLLAIGTSFSTVAHAGEGVWTSGGPPESGLISALAVNPATPSTVYAGTQNGGVFKVHRLRRHLGFRQRDTEGRQRWAINPATPSTLRRGGRRDFFKSTDSGGTWGHPGARREASISTTPPWPSIPRPLPRLCWARRCSHQVDRLGRHLDTLQHGNHEPVRQCLGHQSRYPLHALRRDI